MDTALCKVPAGTHNWEGRDEANRSRALARLGRRVPEHEPGAVIFVELGAAGAHLGHSLEFLESADWLPDSWRETRLTCEAAHAAAGAGLSVIPAPGRCEPPRPPART